MAIFRSASKSKGPEYVLQSNMHGDVKMDSSNIHDPILTAVNEAQPFEEANQSMNNRRPSYLSHDSADLKDIFGQQIKNSDMLNPTRNRNERPLDTIRGFEYAITGDLSYREQLESNRLGWGFHEDFPHYSLTANEESEGQTQNPGFLRPVASFSGGDQPIYQAGNYSASSLNPEQKKKKKGLFGRKKK